MLPSVKIQKTDGNTGVVLPSAAGNLAIIAPAPQGPVNAPATYTRKTDAASDFKAGPLPEMGAYDMDVSGNPVLLINPTASVPATYNGLTVTGAPLSSPAAITAGATDPYDDYPGVIVTFLNAGVRGVTGIQYTYSLDGGQNVSPAQNLGVATTITIPNSGVSFNIGAGNIAAGEQVTCTTTCPRMNNMDLTNALEALRTTKAPWDTVLIFGECDATMVDTVSTWMAALEQRGVYKSAILNTRFRNIAASETEGAYATALGTLLGASAAGEGLSLLVCADGAEMPQPISGIVMKRPTSIFVAARGMSIDVSEDPAYVDRGPILDATLSDARSNPLDHDETLYPGLDDQRLTTLRTFDDPTSPQGTFITNARIFSANGSDYVFWQQGRVMNLLCTIAYQRLTRKLSKGVLKDPATGHILESEAKDIEDDVNGQFDSQAVESTPKRCSAAEFDLSRTDDLTSNAGAIVTGDVKLDALAYIKGFNVRTRFVKTISVSAG